jgi:hypothetical protein
LDSTLRLRLAFRSATGQNGEGAPVPRRPDSPAAERLVLRLRLRQDRRQEPYARAAPRRHNRRRRASLDSAFSPRLHERLSLLAGDPDSRRSLPPERTFHNPYQGRPGQRQARQGERGTGGSTCGAS